MWGGGPFLSHRSCKGQSAQGEGLAENSLKDQGVGGVSEARRRYGKACLELLGGGHWGDAGEGAANLALATHCHMAPAQQGNQCESSPACR